MSESHKRLREEFMAASDWNKSFSALDRICNFIIENPNADSAPVDPEMVRKACETDSECEKFHAAEIINGLTDRSLLSQYPWLYYDYYKSELDFMRQKSSDADLKNIACFGHGAIPSLAIVISDEMPDAHIDMFDIDPDASRLAKDLVDKMGAGKNLSFEIADVSVHESGQLYDLAIVTNAALPYFMQRNSPVSCRNIFLRSATPQASIIYPRIEPSDLSKFGYIHPVHEIDKKYGIHEWILAQRPI